MNLSDIKRLFSNNHFTRQQVDILTRLADTLSAQGGGVSVSDPLKADKATILSVGQGLAGGGDLSANRQFALDLSFTDARYPVLTNGQIPASVVPAQAIHDTFIVADQASMLALSAAGPGDYAVRSDTGNTYVLKQTPASTLANWVLLPAATGISSFNGRTGTVVPASGDYTFDQISAKPTTLSGYGITDAEPAFAAGTTAQYRRGDKTWQTLDKTAVGLPNVDNTADNAKPLGTQQLATLALGTGAGLIGAQAPGSGGLVRDTGTVLYEPQLSLRSYANADGTDETAKVQNWLNALIASPGRRGYVPAGDYRVGDLSLSTDYLLVECHPAARFIGLTGGANPILSVTSATGTATARVGTVIWRGGQFDASARAYSTDGTGAALKLTNYAHVDVRAVRFTGAANHETAISTGKAGYGLRVYDCDRSNVERNVFTGFADAACNISGGSDATAVSDDSIGHLVTGNHFVYCQAGVKATRSARSVACANNEYDTCYVGVAAVEADTANRAARVSVVGEVFRRPGLSAINLRQQSGCVVSSNRIIDCGYKVDGTTAIANSAGILLQGCKGVAVVGNAQRMNDLPALTDSRGIRNEGYTFNAVTDAPSDCMVADNYIQGVALGVSEDGTGVANRYRDNQFTAVTTKYDNIPSVFAPYGSYTPVAAAVSNVAAVTPATAMWRRVEDDITVDFFLSSLQASAAGAGEFTLSLPVDPGVDFAADEQLIGMAFSSTENTGANIRAKQTARLARVLVTFAGSTAHSWGGSFSYRIGATAAPPPPPPPGGNFLTDSAGNFLTDQSGAQITV